MGGHLAGLWSGIGVVVGGVGALNDTVSAMEYYLSVLKVNARLLHKSIQQVPCCPHSVNMSPGGMSEQGSRRSRKSKTKEHIQVSNKEHDQGKEREQEGGRSRRSKE